MEVLYFLYPVLKVLTVVAAVGFFISALDDIFVDIYYMVRQSYRRLFKLKHYKPLTEEDLAANPEKYVAIMVPAWQEEPVIARMLRHSLKVLNYTNYDIFVGTYPNDEGTQLRVAEVLPEDPRVHRIVCPHPGPTNKADCLNWIFQGIKTHEAKTGKRYEILVIQDAEDMVHPLSIKLFNHLIPRKDMVQLPVIPMEMPLRHFTAGTYMDEFAESHTKDLLVRERISKMIPGAGVGTAFHRTAADELAALNGNQLFNVDTLTEDYDFGFRLEKQKKKIILAKFFVERTQIVRKQTAKGERIEKVKVKEFVATREYFPTRFRDAMRQKSRWVMGIVFQSWSQLGWTGRIGNLFMLYRDRKAIFSSLIPILGYILMPYWGLYLYYQLFTPPPNPLPILVDSRWLWWLIIIDTVIMLERWIQKIVALHTVANWKHALISFPRMGWCNLINFCAMAIAMRQYAEYRFSGKRVAWSKTAHVFPSEQELLAYRRKLGDMLLENRLITLSQLSEALEEQKDSDQQIGEILVRLGHISEDNLISILGDQLQVETRRIDPAGIDPTLIKIIPERVARRHHIVPLERIDHWGLRVATTRPEDSALKRMLEAYAQQPIKFVLSGSRPIRIAIDRVYAGKASDSSKIATG